MRGLLGAMEEPPAVELPWPLPWLPRTPPGAADLPRARLGGRLCVCGETFWKCWSHVRSRQSQVLVCGIVEVRLGHTEADPRQQWFPRTGACCPLAGERSSAVHRPLPCAWLSLRGPGWGSSSLRHACIPAAGMRRHKTRGRGAAPPIT